MTQLNYTNAVPAGFEGQVADTWPIKAVETLLPSTAIPVGRFTVVDTTGGTQDNAAKLPAAAADITKLKFMGVSLLDLSRESGVGGAGIDYPAARPMPGLALGRVWMKSETAMAKGTAPFVRWADGNGGLVAKGVLRNSADQVAAADTATQYPNARVLQTTAAAGLVLVEFF